jgi:hypothetical protein
MLAPEGTIPVRRLTLEITSRFRSLREFFQKSPGATGAGTCFPLSLASKAPRMRYFPSNRASE